MVTKEEFNKVWSESTTEDILNQFYYEHNDLRELLKENGNKEEVIKRQQEAIEKAIEYIKKYCIDDEFYINLSDKEKAIIEVLNILQNGSDDNE